MTTRASRSALPALAGLALAALFALAASRSFAACTYYYATPGVYQSVPDAMRPYILRSAWLNDDWMVMAVRTQVSDDWDIGLYQSTSGTLCVKDMLASSAYSGSIVDFVVGDYYGQPHDEVYPDITRYTGTGSAMALTRAASLSLPANGSLAASTWGPDSIFQVWNASLEAGRNYTVRFEHDAGLGASVLVFHNPGTGTYFAGRPSADAEFTATGTFTTSTAGRYAFVVVNDNHGSGTVRIGVAPCATPTVLVSGVPVTYASHYASWQYAQSAAFWSAVAVRSGVANADVSLFGNTTPDGTDACFGALKARSSAATGVDFVVGDYNYTPFGTCFATTTAPVLGASTTVEWDDGPDLLTVNAANTTRAFTAGDLIDVYDVQLTGGYVYNFGLAAGGANVHMLLFRNTAGGTYIVGRAAAVFDHRDGCWSYTAPASGYYGVVVTMEAGLPGSYTIGVTNSTCGCPPLLSVNAPTSVPPTDAHYGVLPNDYSWNLVAVRGQATSDDWDLTVSAMPVGSGPPACIGTTAASSAFGAGVVDYVAIDGNYSRNLPWYAHPHQYSAGSNPGLIEWVGSSGVLWENDPTTFATFTALELAHAYDAWMEAGVGYVIHFEDRYLPGVVCQVLENTGGGLLAAPRSMGVGVGSELFYTPTVTGYHALVVMNDSSATGWYRINFGRCSSPLPLASGVAQAPSTGVAFYSFAQPARRWAAVGLRATTARWMLESGALGTPGFFPTCLASGYANTGMESPSTARVLACDFHSAPTGACGLWAEQVDDAPRQSALVEWESGSTALVPNDLTGVSGSTSASDVLNCWDVQLEAGITYSFQLSMTGSAALHLLLFRKPAWSDWLTRFDAVLDVPAATGTATYAAPATDDYGVVVVNDDGGNATYQVTVKYCAPPVALASGTPVNVAQQVGWESFAQFNPYWTAVGVRSGVDYDLAVYQTGTGGAPGLCYTNALSGSGVSPPQVDFVVGDFNYGGNPFGTYYSRVARSGSTGSAQVEWRRGDQGLALGSPPVSFTTGPNDVLEIWDVYLEAGKSYGLYFAHTGAADVKALLFRNSGGVYWAPRGYRVLETAGHANYTPPATGWYGLVVVNDNGAAGDYQLGIFQGGVDVEPNAPPAVTALRGAAPNPSRGDMQIEYALHEAAAVRLEVLDMAGRRVATLEDGERPAGTWRVSLANAKSGGGALPPGLYFVRLQVAGRTVGEKKVALVQ